MVPIILLMVVAAMPALLALALHRTRLWWLAGSLTYLAAAAMRRAARRRDA